MRPTGSILLFLLFFAISCNIIYTPVTKVDLNDDAIGDTKIYIAMFEGQKLKEIPKPFRYRILVPYLARLIPAPPKFLVYGFQIDSNKMIKYKFGVVNAIGLAMAAWFLFLFCWRLRLGLHLSIIGSFLFLTSFYILNYAGLPYSDAFAYFFLISCLYAVLVNNNLMLFFLFSLGIFAKETIILVFIYIFYKEQTWLQRLWRGLFCIPGFLAYLVIRFAVLPTDMGYNYTFYRFLDTLKIYQLGYAPWIFAAVNVIFAFGFLWILSFRGFQIARRDKNRELLAILPILPVTLIIPFLIGADLGRIWFLGFPAIIPLSLLGLQYYLSDLDSVLK